MLLTALACVPASAEIPPLPSEEFPGKYEADLAPEDDRPSWALVAEGVGNQSKIQNGILEFSSTTLDDAAGFFYWRLPLAIWTKGAADQGYTVEIRMKAAPEKFVGLNLSRSEEAGAGYAVLRIGPVGTEWLSGAGDGIWTTLDDADNTTGFQTFRIVKMPRSEAGPGLFAVYRNGRLIEDNLIGQQNTAEIKEDRFMFGDIGTWDAAGEIDYVRWEPAGAYSPPPEQP